MKRLSLIMLVLLISVVPRVLAITPIPTLSKKPSPSTTSATPTSTSNETPPYPLIFGILGTTLGISSIALTLWLLKQLQQSNGRRLDQLEEADRKLKREILDSIKKLITQTNKEKELNSSRISELTQELLNIKASITKNYQEIDQLKQEQNRIKQVGISTSYQKELTENRTNIQILEPKIISEVDNTSKFIDEIISEFNQGNKDYFRDKNKFQPFALTPKSQEGQRDAGFSLIIELESSSADSSYLKTEINKQNWLIPNITSMYLSKILTNLDKYPEIFEMINTTEISGLIKLAKLRSIDGKLWQIEEPGQLSRQQ